jgi:fermentation-respiration switch protein FrsA (DUF1100 family)
MATPRVSRRAAGLLMAAALALPGCSMIDSFTFFPDRAMGPPPAGVEERTIATADGERLHAWYAGGAAEAPALVWSHGNAGNISGRADILRALAARGLRVLAYDYRGYGRSTGTPSEAGVYRDAVAAFDDLVARGTPPERIVLFGESLGGAVSIALAGERPCAGVAVVSSFTTLADVARRHYGFLGAVAGKRFDSRTRVGRLAVPLLVAHGDRDEIVPFELGEALFAAAAPRKRFLRIAGAQHNDALARPDLLDAVAEFAREVAGGG